ncbi:unnamed protein product [[Candida] boidinii]|nr:unnamed protein product [[Candida] boidinii]
MASKDRQAYRYTKDNIVGYVWAGSMVQNSGAANNGFKNLIYELDNWGMPNMFYIEYVNGNPMHGWGAIFDQTGNLGRVQEAVKLWSAGQSVKKFANRKTYQSQSLCYLSYSGRKNEGNDGEAGTCFYVKIASGKTAADQTGVPGEYLKVYNDHVDFTKLVVGQPICYTLGSLPSFKPSQKSNHECYDYLVQKGDSCSALAAQYYPLSVADIENYNKKTYGWSGCKNLQANTKMCLSDGTPMRPKSNPLAECGPLAPAELYLKACPLNACCSQFGFCAVHQTLLFLLHFG